MSRGIWLGCLLAATAALYSTSEARAGDPAIAETNGLFSIELGYQRAGVNGSDRVFNGVGVPGDNFRECTNNDCSGLPLAQTIIFGGQGQKSGFAGYGGIEGAMPLGHDFGIQFDGQLGGFSGAGGGEATLHAFRGDPAVGLIGPMVDYRALGDASYLRAAAEGQFYWKDFTLYGNAGYQWASDSDQFNVDRGVVGCGYVAYYPMESLMLRAGGGGGTGPVAGFGQIEWQAFQHSAPGVSFFVEGLAASNDGSAAFAGLHYHIGAGNSLEMRHRHELPLRQTLCGVEQFATPGADVFNIYSIE